MPLAIAHGHVFGELQEDGGIFIVLAKQVDVDAGIDGLHQDLLVGRVEFVVNGVKREIGSSFSSGFKLHPHGDRQFLLGVVGTAQSERNHQAGRAGLGLFGERQVVVNLDRFATVFAGQIKGTSANKSRWSNRCKWQPERKR